MKHLENYGVQELNAKEMTQTDGGFWPIVLAVGLYVMSEWDDISAGFNDGINGNGYNYQSC